MSVQIKYGGQNPFDGLPVPFVERSTSYVEQNSSSGAIEEIVLTGQIPPPEDNCDRFSYFIDEQASLLSYFSSSYGTLEIVEYGVTILERKNVKIDSVSFNDSNYSSILEYTISLQVFLGEFMKYYGVTDVSNTVSYNKEKNKTLRIEHQVSATGIRDSDSASTTTALEKAKAFVEAEISSENIDLSPILISHYNYSDDELPATATSTSTPSSYFAQAKPVLESISENINRVTGFYSVSKSYVSDLYFNSGGVLRYTVAANLAPEGYSEVTVSGSIKYNEDISGSENFELLESRFMGFDFFGAAKRLSGVSRLNKIPINRSVSKDKEKNNLSFSFVFDNNPQFLSESSTEESLTFDFSNDSGFVTLQVSGQIIGRLGIKNRWEIVNKAFDELDIYSKAKIAYDAYCEEISGISSSLNDNILSESATYSEASGSINFTYNFDNFSQTIDNDLFISFNYSKSKAHPVFDRVATKCADGSWVVQNTQTCDPGRISVSGDAIMKPGVECSDAIQKIQQWATGWVGPLEGCLVSNMTFNGVSRLSFSFESADRNIPQ